MTREEQRDFAELSRSHFISLPVESEQVTSSMQEHFISLPVESEQVRSSMQEHFISACKKQKHEQVTSSMQEEQEDFEELHLISTPVACKKLEQVTSSMQEEQEDFEELHLISTPVACKKLEQVTSSMQEELHFISLPVESEQVPSSMQEHFISLPVESEQVPSSMQEELHLLSTPVACKKLEQVTSSTRSLELVSSVWRLRTVLFVDIKGFTSTCAATKNLKETGDWVQRLYITTQSLCATHNVHYMESRGDCCVCCTPPLGKVQAMLSLAHDLHEQLAQTHTLRMGMCTGDVHILQGEDFLAVFGETSELADRMQALARPGTMFVHHTTSQLWADETQHPKPPLHRGEFAEYRLHVGRFALCRSSSF